MNTSSLSNLSTSATSLFLRPPSQQFVIIFGMCTLLLGSIGNVFIMIIIAFYKTMRPSSRLLFFTLALTDEMTLLLAETRYWILAFYGVDIRASSVINCRMHAFFTYTFMNTSVWLLCVISIERTCLTFIPLKNHLFQRFHNVIIIIILIVVLNGAKNTFLLSLDYEGGICKLYTFINHGTIEIVNLVVSFLVPYFIMLITASMLMWKMFRQKVTLNEDNSASRLRSATAMLVAVVIIQLILGLPGYIYSVWAAIHTSVFDFIHDQDYTVLLTLTVANNAVNFYAYILSSHGFRQTFFQLCEMLLTCFVNFSPKFSCRSNRVTDGCDENGILKNISTKPKS